MACCPHSTRVLPLIRDFLTSHVPSARQASVCRGAEWTPSNCPHPCTGCHIHPAPMLASEGFQRMEGAAAGCAPVRQIWGGRVPESLGRQEKPGQPAAISPQTVASLCVQESTGVKREVQKSQDSRQNPAQFDPTHFSRYISSQESYLSNCPDFLQLALPSRPSLICDRKVSPHLFISQDSTQILPPPRRSQSNLVLAHPYWVEVMASSCHTLATNMFIQQLCVEHLT